MIKTTILAVTILFFGTMMVQEAYAPDILNVKAIPSWVDGVMDFYLRGDISEREMLDAFDYLFKNNIMHMSQEAAQEVAELRAEVNELRQANAELLEARESGNESAAISSLRESTTEPFVPGGAVLSAATSGIAAMDVPTESGTQTVLVVGGENTDVNELVQWVLRESYLEQTEDLAYYADKVRYYNELKDAVRDEATRSANPDVLNPDILNPDVLNPDIANPDIANPDVVNPDVANPDIANPDIISEQLKPLEDENDSMMAEFLKLQAQYDSAEADTLDVANQIQANLDAKKQLREDISELSDIMTADSWPVKYSYYDENGRVVSVALNSAGDAWALAVEFDQRLQTLDDMSQMMQLQLQDAMQKQQQVMQTISSIMKSWHDSAMSIIRNLK